ncbi:hypothetical protein JCM10212_002491, partial [Sporobolomyces blumeae]
MVQHGLGASLSLTRSTAWSTRVPFRLGSSSSLPRFRSTTTTTSQHKIAADHLRHPAFADLEDRLAEELPCFRTRADECVRVLYEPREFYHTLIDKISNAKRRIFLASLYVGKEETQLVSTLHSALKANPSLRVVILTDYLRSTREHPLPCSASLLASLHAAFPHQVDLRLFHTPALNGWTRKVVPKRFNEGWGLQHMKVYGVDDDVIISGANLSRDYFTNRQDRYISFDHHPPFADFFSSLVDTVSLSSYRVVARDTSSEHPEISIEWPDSNPFPCAPFDRPHLVPSFTYETSEAIKRLVREWNAKDWTRLASPLPPFSTTSTTTSSDSRSPIPHEAPSTTTTTTTPSSPDPSNPASLRANPPSPIRSRSTRSLYQSYDTSLTPLLQMAPFSISHETSLVVPSIFRCANQLATAPGGNETTIDWTSGYFGLRRSYKELVLETKAKIRIVSASPE